VNFATVLKDGIEDSDEADLMLGAWLEAVLPLSSTGEAWRTSDDRHAKTA
jgi:hypothetical protein